jgi:hypothetical protein
VTDPPTLYTRFRGGWCDNCRTAYPYIPRNGNCPDCGPIRLRPATITVEPDDADAVARDNLAQVPDAPPSR